MQIENDDSDLNEVLISVNERGLTTVVPFAVSVLGYRIRTSISQVFVG